MNILSTLRTSFYFYFSLFVVLEIEPISITKLHLWPKDRFLRPKVNVEKGWGRGWRWEEPGLIHLGPGLERSAPGLQHTPGNSQAKDWSISPEA